MLRKNKSTRLLLTLLVAVIFLMLVGFITRQIEYAMHPRKFDASVTRYAKEYGGPEYIVYSVIFVESGFVSDAVSVKGACGLMQLMPDTYLWLVKEQGESKGDILDPDENIRYGTLYLSMLYKKYGNWKYALCAYNAGPGNVDEWLEGAELEIPFAETQNYVKKLEVVIERYRRLYYR